MPPAPTIATVRPARPKPAGAPQLAARAASGSRRGAASSSASACSAVERGERARGRGEHALAAVQDAGASHRSTPADGSCTQRTRSGSGCGKADGSFPFQTTASASASAAGSPPPARTASSSAASGSGPTWTAGGRPALVTGGSGCAPPTIPMSARKATTTTTHSKPVTSCVPTSHMTRRRASSRAG